MALCMTINTRNAVTMSAEKQFFLGPEKALHRHYEALRACLVEEASS